MKYSKQEIMRTAWMLIKAYGVSRSVALRSAWALAKAVNSAASHLDDYCGHARITVNDWIKYGKNRTYISVRHYTNAWNLKHETRIGYVDNLSGAFCHD